jgi:hypothetical protein
MVEWWLLRRKVRAVVAQELVEEDVKARRSIYFEGPEDCRIDDRSTVGRSRDRDHERASGGRQEGACRRPGTREPKMSNAIGDSHLITVFITSPHW